MGSALGVRHGALEREPQRGIARPQSLERRAIDYAYDCITGAVQCYVLADHVARAVELMPPQLGADDHHGTRSGAMFLSAKCASGDGLDAEHGEVVLRNQDAN